MRSMTGFGKSNFTYNEINYNIEIKSYNYKGLDIKTYLPEFLYDYEFQIINLLKSKIKKGTIKFFIKEDFSCSEENNYKNFKNFVDTYLLFKKKYFDETKIDLPYEIINGNSKLINFFSKESITKISEEDYKNFIEPKISETIDIFKNMSKVEGNNLKAFFIETFDKLKENTKNLNELIPIVINEYKDKLKKRVEELLSSGIEVDQYILANEIAFYSTKIDIKEEITRMESHLKQAFSLLNLENEAVGDKFNFLLQEMLREVNTISSKSTSIDIINITLNMKNLISMLKEQILNIE